MQSLPVIFDERWFIRRHTTEHLVILLTKFRMVLSRKDLTISMIDESLNMKKHMQIVTEGLP